MGYVKSSEEVAAIQRLLSPAMFTLEGVSIEFETTPQFVAEVLPPCFEPAGTSGLATTTVWQSAVCGEFESAAVMINARYGDAVGTYFLTLVVSGDMPVTLGRELWGEPKKPGTAQLFRDGNALYGYGERHGTRIIEIEATFTQNLGPKRTDSHALELAGALTDDGRLLGDAAAIVFAVDRRMDSVRCGHGELRLTGTQFDPVSEIPIVSTGLALHYTGEAAYQQISRTPLADGEDYLPYILGRNFDDLYRFRRPTRHRDLVGAPDTVAPTLTDRRQ